MKSLILRLLPVLLVGLLIIAGPHAASAQEVKPRVQLGAYYFDGWAGKNLAVQKGENWAVNPPTHLTRRFVQEFGGREPVWGWRDDTAEVMERQIDLAADNGLSFFAFDWYWSDNGKSIDVKAIEEDPRQTGLMLFLKAKNRQRMKFCLMVANHGRSQIIGTEAWKQAADYWLKFLKDPQCLTIGGKPAIIIFDPKASDKDALVYLQEQAKKNGLPGVAVVGSGSGTAQTGYSARTHYSLAQGFAKGSEEHKYAEIIKALEVVLGWKQPLPYIPSATAGMDRRPWEGSQSRNETPSWYYPDRTPAAFEVLLRKMVQWMDDNPDKITAERLAVVYAWNEFGEGGYVAPTKDDPDGAYLKVIRRVVLGEKAGQQPAEIPKTGQGAAGGKMALPDDIDLRADIVYKKVGEESIALDMYGLKGKKYEHAPLLVFIHGGGYVSSSKQEILGRIGEIALPLIREHGYRVASLDYRLCSVKGAKVIDCSTDCKDAMRFLAKNCETYGIDPNRMATLGSSAGGSLSLLQALTKDSDLVGDPELAACPARAKCAVAWYGATDFTAPGFRDQVGAARTGQRMPVLFKSTPEDNLREYEDVSPVCYMKRNGFKPPMLLMHGDHDLTAPIQQAEWMEEQAKKLGVPVTFIMVKNAGHNFKEVSGPISPDRKEINRLTTQFILDNNK